MRANLPPREFFIGKEIPGREGYRIVEHIESGGNGRVFRAYSEQLKNSLACKLIPRSNLLASHDWKLEAQKANSIQNPIVVKYDTPIEWKGRYEGVEIDCVGFCAQYINGVSLKRYIQANKGNITIHFTEMFLKNILELLNETEFKSIPHGDLHAGNVLVEERNEFQLAPTDSIKVIDFGVGSSDKLAKNDFDQTAIILKSLLENIEYTTCSPRDKFAFNVLNDHFLRHLTEQDLTRDPYARRPKNLFDKLNDITKTFSEAQAASESITLTTPFDYLSCEQIGSAHSLLQTLYSNLFLGLDIIESPNNLVLTGPRGCGKSTVFKSLSLKHRLNVKDESAANLKYIGVYYRCDDLYFSFPRYQTPVNPEALDLPVHFFVATLIIEVLDTIQAWSTKYFSEAFSKTEPILSQKIWHLLELEHDTTFENNHFQPIANRLRKERKRAVEKQRLINDPSQKLGKYFSPGVLIGVCDLIQSEFYFLDSKPFFFFIDDYSDPKITIALQKNLNRIVMSRSSSCFFKVSTESSISYAKSDVDGKNYVEGREFILQDLGLTFLVEDQGRKLAFIEDIFRRRLNAIDGYPVKALDELVGNSSSKSQNEIALKIREGKVEWYGKEVLIDLCSGDVHYIINLVGKMVSSVGNAEGISAIETSPKIATALQNKAIREEAGNFLSNLKGTFKNGQALVEVVTAFGNVAHSNLLYRDSKNEGSSSPHQASRIEPYEDPKLSAEAQYIYSELIRYSVFIEDRRGKSIRGNVVTRLFLRRFLIPHFNLTFNKRNSIQLEPGEMETLLLHPKEFVTQKLLRQAGEILPDASQTSLKFEG